VEVDHQEKRRCTHRVHVADQPAELNVAHDVLHGFKGVRGRIEHGQPDTGEQLVHQHHDGQHAEDIPDIEILGRVILRHVLAEGLDNG
jgi:hypothetical protein